jgi:choline transport protein
MATPLDEKKNSIEAAGAPEELVVTVDESGIALNASGHKDQLKRQYGLLGICGLAL